MFDERFAFMMRERSEKPREEGITMILGEAVFSMGGMNYLQDLLAVNGAWIDWYKFVWSSFPLQSPSLRARKIELLNEHDVRSFSGGNFFEAAIAQGYEDEFLTAISDARCPGIEVSTTIIDVSLEEKAELIEKAVNHGLHVHGEIGRKATETEGESLTTAEAIEDMRACLDAGAEMVVYETEEVEGIFEDDSGVGTDESMLEQVEEIARAVGQENILFEVPISSDLHEMLEISGWFIKNLGPEVNLGNINPMMVSMVEQQRRGIGAHQ